MMTTLVHLVAVVALHGALSDVADEVARRGYLSLFILIAAESFAFPLPGEVSLLVGAYEAQRGLFGLGWVMLVGALAAICGDNLAYWFGRRSGRALVERLLGLLHVRLAYLERADAYFDRRGGLTVFVARQLSPLRGLAALSAGTTHLPWRRFALFNALGCVVWATAVTLIAWLFVGHLDELADDLSLAGLIALGLIGLVAAVVLWRRFRRRMTRSGETGDVDDGSAEQSPLADHGSAEHSDLASKPPARGSR